LVEQRGMSYARAAQRMGLTAGRVRLLVVQERDYQDLKRYKLALIPSERVRTFLERELARTPGLRRAEVAHHLNMRQIDLDRQLGYEPGKNGRKQRHIGIPAASRLVIALGRAPIDLDGC
jgi:hypothetical protein